ncbi:unnamed protein product [Meganyctiphanes norvegica]|uniref:Caspase family p20 domain-containing protein n=1 Tax=Meganyctiphanes norvegica TaxID=48144 RepID=A0AAV2R3F1_MEGNR
MATNKANADLRAAVLGRDPAGVRAALDLGANPITPNQYGTSALSWAFWKAIWTDTDQCILNTMLRHPGVDVNQRLGGSGGWTALMHAATHGHTEACTTLLEEGADPLFTDDRGWTAIYKAAWGGHRQTAETIINWGGDPQKKSNNGELPAGAARRAGHTSLATWLDHQHQLPRRVGQIVPLNEYTTYVYPNSKGLVIFMNYMNFTNSAHDMTRYGADSDERNVRYTFELLGYSFKYHQDLNYLQTETELSAIVKSQSLWLIDSLILLIGTHGGERTMFRTSDNKDYDITWVRDLFSDENCPAMKNKPKLIVCNFCRGSYREDEKDDVSAAALGRRGVHEVMVKGKPRKALHKISHMVTLFPCSEDVSALRNIYSGSYFFSALCTTLEGNQKDELNAIVSKTAKALENQNKPLPQLVTEPPFFKFVFKCRPQSKGVMDGCNIN